MTREHKDRMKTQTTSSGARYAANNVTTITDIVHNELAQFVNNMPFFQQGEPNDENADPNVCPPVTEQAYAALTAIELKEIFKSMMSEFKSVDRRGGGGGRNRKPVPQAQGTDSDGNKSTYCTAGPMESKLIFTTTAKAASALRRVTKNRQHFRTNWAAALNFARTTDAPILTEKGSIGNHILLSKDKTKLSLQCNSMSAPQQFINVKLDSGASANFHEISHHLQHCPTPTDNPSVSVIVPNGNIMT